MTGCSDWSDNGNVMDRLAHCAWEMHIHIHWRAPQGAIGHSSYPLLSSSAILQLPTVRKTILPPQDESKPSFEERGWGGGEGGSKLQVYRCRRTAARGNGRFWQASMRIPLSVSGHRYSVGLRLYVQVAFFYIGYIESRNVCLITAWVVSKIPVWNSQIFLCPHWVYPELVAIDCVQTFFANASYIVVANDAGHAVYGAITESRWARGNDGK